MKKDIRLEYESGTVRELPSSVFGITLKRLIEDIKNTNSETYHKFIDGPLERAYVNGELVLDKEAVLQEVEE